MTWPTKKLNDLLETCDAGVWGKPAMSGKGLFVLRSTNMTNDGHLDFSDVAERKIEGNTKKIKLSDGDILVEKSGGGPDQPVGRVAYFLAPDDQSYSFANFIQRLRVKPNLIDSRFLFYRLLFLHKIGFTKKLQSQTTGIRNLKLSLYLKTEIPTPPLSIQKQIVERLDKIAEAQELNDKQIVLADELFRSLRNNELNIKVKKQKWSLIKLGDILDYEQPGKYIVQKEILEEETENCIPVLTANKAFILGYTDEKEGVCKDTPVIIFDDFTTDKKFVNFPFKVKSSAMKILKSKTQNTNLKFIFETMETIKFNHEIHKRYYLSEYQYIKIPLPSFETQKQIVEKLSAVQDYKKKLLEQKQKLQELFDSILNKSFN